VAQVVVLGAFAPHVAAGLAAAGGPTPTLTDDPVVAARAIASASGEGDWILLKASRGMRLERVLDALRAELG
jgi:UDP-N-acetylmuramyl pentapeptide synthase